MAQKIAPDTLLDSQVKMWNHRASLLAYLACLNRLASQGLIPNEFLAWGVVRRIVFFLPQYTSSRECLAEQAHYLLQGHIKGAMIFHLHTPWAVLPLMRYIKPALQAGRSNHGHAYVKTQLNIPFQRLARGPIGKNRKKPYTIRGSFQATVWGQASPFEEAMNDVMATGRLKLSGHDSLHVALQDVHHNWWARRALRLESELAEVQERLLVT